MLMNKKRIFSDEFKTEAVRRVVEDGRRPAEVARELGVARQQMQSWLARAKELGTAKPELGESERDELARLRRENTRLKMEREILKKAAAFFAKENQ